MDLDWNYEREHDGNDLVFICDWCSLGKSGLDLWIEDDIEIDDEKYHFYWSVMFAEEPIITSKPIKYFKSIDNAKKDGIKAVRKLGLELLKAVI